MELIKKYQFHNCDAFHLILSVNLKKGNEISSSMPLEYVKRVAGNLIHQIKFAYIPFRKEGNILLDKLAEQLIKQERSADFFYPNYLLTDSKIEPEIAAKIINLYEIFFAYPRTHYSARSSPCEFYVMSSFFYSQKQQICSNAKQISLAEFEDNLITPIMKMDYFNLKNKSSKAYILIECDASEFTILCSSEDKVLMIISH